MRAVLLVIAAIALTAAAPPKKAEAALLLGRTLRYEVIDNVTPVFSPSSFVVSDVGSPEIPVAYPGTLNNLSIDIFDTSIVVSVFDDGTDNTLSFNNGGDFFGFSLFDVNSEIGDITVDSVVPNGFTTITSVTPISRTDGSNANTVLFNLKNLDFSAGGAVTINLSGSSPPLGSSGSGAVP